MNEDREIYAAIQQSMELKTRMFKLKELAANRLDAMMNRVENEVNTSDKILAMEGCIAIKKFIKMMGYIDGSKNDPRIMGDDHMILEKILSVLR